MNNSHKNKEEYAKKHGLGRTGVALGEAIFLYTCHAFCNIFYV